MARIPAVQMSHDPEGKAIEVALFSQDFSKVFIPVVDERTLRKMKDRSDKYSFVSWTAVPPSGVNAEEVQSEAEVRS